MSTVIRGQQGGSIGNAVEGGGFCFASTTYSEGCSKGPLDAGLLENGANVTEGCTDGPLDLGFLDNGVNAEAGNDSSGGGPIRSDAPAFPTTGTFGNTAAGVAYTSCINQIDGSTFTTPTVPGSVWVTGIHALVQCDTANKTFNAAIYNSAKALVGQCNAVTVAIKRVHSSLCLLQQTRYNLHLTQPTSWLFGAAAPQEMAVCTTLLEAQIKATLTLQRTHLLFQAASERSPSTMMSIAFTRITTCFKGVNKTKC